MGELPPGEPPAEPTLSILQSEQVQTRHGAVYRNDIVYGGNPRTVFSSSENTPQQLRNLTKDILGAERVSISPFFQNKLAEQQTPLETVVLNSAQQYLTDLSLGVVDPEIQESVIFSLIQQKAYQILFDEAKKTDR